MKFRVTLIEERVREIDVVDINAAEAYAVATVNRLGRFPRVKILSIHHITPISDKDDKPPTPFGKPPSGTLGGGQMKIAEELPDAVAA